MKYQHFLIVGGLALVLAIVLFILSTGGPGGDDFVYSGPVIAIDAEKLAREYKFDPEKAEERYTNKGVEVTALVLDVDKKLILTEDASIECYFSDKNRAEVERQIRPDDIVTVRGLCTGVDRRRSSFALILKGCEVVQHHKGPEL